MASAAELKPRWQLLPKGVGLIGVFHLPRSFEREVGQLIYIRSERIASFSALYAPTRKLPESALAPRGATVFFQVPTAAQPAEIPFYRKMFSLSPAAALPVLLSAALGTRSDGGPPIGVCTKTSATAPHRTCYRGGRPALIENTDP